MNQLEEKQEGNLEEGIVNPFGCLACPAAVRKAVQVLKESKNKSTPYCQKQLLEKLQLLSFSVTLAEIKIAGQEQNGLEAMQLEFSGLEKKTSWQEWFAQRLKKNNNQSEVRARERADEIKKLEAELKGLITKGRIQEAKVKAGELEIKVVEDLRFFIKDEIMDKETAATKDFCDYSFAVQLMLAKHWPLNNRNKRGEPLDAISLETIEPENLVASSLGHVYDKKLLEGYFSSESAFRHNSGKLEVIDAETRTAYSPRDLSYFEKVKKIKIARPLVLPNNAAVEVNNFRVRRGENPYESLLRNFTQKIRMLFNRFPKWTVAIKGLFFGGLVGLGVGIILGQFLVLTFILSAINLAPIVAPIIMLSSGLLCGFAEKKRRHGQGFLAGFKVGVLGSGLVLFAASFGPVLIGALGAASLLSLTAVAVATTIWTTIIQPAMLLAIAALALSEFFNPGIMKRTFDNIYKVVTFIPMLFSATACGIVGGFLGLTVLLGQSLGSLCSRLRPVQRNALEAEVVQSSPASSRLSLGARIHAAFRRDVRPPVVSLSPDAERALQLSMESEDSASLPMAAFLERQQERYTQLSAVNQAPEVKEDHPFLMPFPRA